jgi:hypothetical protein
VAPACIAAQRLGAKDILPGIIICSVVDEKGPRYSFETAHHGIPIRDVTFLTGEPPLDEYRYLFSGRTRELARRRDAARDRRARRWRTVDLSTRAATAELAQSLSRLIHLDRTRVVEANSADPASRQFAVCRGSRAAATLSLPTRSTTDAIASSQTRSDRCRGIRSPPATESSAPDRRSRSDPPRTGRAKSLGRPCQ